MSVTLKDPFLLFGQCLSNKGGRALWREKEPHCSPVVLGCFLSLGHKGSLGLSFIGELQTQLNVFFSFESARPGFKVQLCHLSPVCLWAKHFPSPPFPHLESENAAIKTTISQGCWED